MKTNRIERGEMTREERKARLDALIVRLESTTEEAEMRELEGMRDELKARQNEIRRIREIQSIMRI